MKKHGTIWLFITFAFVLPVTAYALVQWYENKAQRLPIYSDVKKSFAFINQDKVVISDDIWKNKIVVANFFFTHCPVVCPKMTRSLKTVQSTFSKDKNIVISSFTVDPERDSAARLNVYARRFNIHSPGWQLLTGDKKDIYRFARNEMKVVATDGDGGPADFIHSDKLVLIDKQKKIRGYYDGTNEKEVNELIQDIKKLKNEN